MIIDNQAVVRSSVGKTDFTWYTDNSTRVYDMMEKEVKSPSPFIETTVPRFFGSHGKIKLQPKIAHIQDNTLNKNPLATNMRGTSIQVENKVSEVINCGAFIYIRDKNDDLATNVMNKKIVLTTATNKAEVYFCGEIDTNKSIKQGLAFCYDEEYMNEYIEKFKVSVPCIETAVVHPTAYRYLYNEAVVMVENTVPLAGHGTLTIPPVMINVENYRPPTFGNTGSGSAMRDFKIVAQKQSFVEVVLNFEDANVLDVIGLPDGMVYDNVLKMIKGSPILSGKYPITLELDNGYKLEGLVVVPQLPRQM